MHRPPAILGGHPSFEAPLYVTKPSLPAFGAIVDKLSYMYDTARLSNNARFVTEFEASICERLQVRNCITMCNGTLTLILALKSLGLKGKVVVPSFTFCATVHAVVWAGLEPVFADIDANTFNITPQTVEAVLSSDVAAVMPVHAFGNPCDIAGFESLAKKHRIKLLFDSAQAFGSEYHGKPLGSFGDMESFSVHATKILPTGEGGLITTNNDDLAEYLRSARNFGFSDGQDCIMPGINAKMAEFPAVMGIEGLKILDKALARRQKLVERYRGWLLGIPGIKLQSPSPTANLSWQNLAMVLDESVFGLSRDHLSAALKAENIFGREYFYPPVHRMSAYAQMGSERLPNTDWLSDRVLCLPLYSDMPVRTVDKICVAVEKLHRNALAVQQVFSPTPMMPDHPTEAVPVGDMLVFC